jgi:hypothetical protein
MRNLVDIYRELQIGVLDWLSVGIIVMSLVLGLYIMKAVSFILGIIVFFALFAVGMYVMDYSFTKVHSYDDDEDF